MGDAWEGGGGRDTGPCCGPRGGRKRAEGRRLIYGRVRGQWAERLGGPLCRLKGQWSRLSGERCAFDNFYSIVQMLLPLSENLEITAKIRQGKQRDLTSRADNRPAC